ncbi:hypothetical protein ACQP10_34700 [Streptosporangium sandarakinum]|uniref:hypothetical protein n=1 Tax=Streptosporangium TaxID=2000 RepID=UPI0031F82FC4
MEHPSITARRGGSPFRRVAARAVAATDVIGSLLRGVAAAGVIGAILAAGGCAADPETDGDRAPGPAAHEVVVTGNDVSGVTARIAGWEHDRNNALPPQNVIRVDIRFTGRTEWALSSRFIELAVCAVTGQRTVVTCGTAGMRMDHTAEDRYHHTVETFMGAGYPLDQVTDVLLLPDQYAPPRVSIVTDPKDGDDYVAPRLPKPGDRV